RQLRSDDEGTVCIVDAVIVSREVLTFAKVELRQVHPKGLILGDRWPVVEARTDEADASGLTRLLGACGGRPGGHRTTNTGNEFPTAHSTLTTTVTRPRISDDVAQGALLSFSHEARLLAPSDAEAQKSRKRADLTASS